MTVRVTYSRFGRVRYSSRRLRAKAIRNFREQREGKNYIGSTRVRVFKYMKASPKTQTGRCRYNTNGHRHLTSVCVTHMSFHLHAQTAPAMCHVYDREEDPGGVALPAARPMSYLPRRVRTVTRPAVQVGLRGGLQRAASSCAYSEAMNGVSFTRYSSRASRLVEREGPVDFVRIWVKIPVR